MIVKNNAPRVIELTPAVRLMPGNNTIPAEHRAEFAAAMKTPAARGLVKEKVLELEEAQSFGRLSAERQAEVVAETTDRALLTQWAEETKSATVQKAIVERLEVLKHPRQQAPAQP